MANLVRVEWIGVRSVLEDDRISIRKMLGLYSDQEEVLLEAVADYTSPLVRQKGSTARAKGKRDGYSKEYTFGPWNFVEHMTELDADRLFKSDPDEQEFRNLDDPAHDNRKPVVPWQYINKVMHRIIKEAENGPGVVLKGQAVARTNKDADAIIKGWVNDRVDKAREYGVKLDPETMRIVR